MRAAKAKNTLDGDQFAQNIRRILKGRGLEDSLEYSEPHPYFTPSSHDNDVRLRMLDILAAVVETIKNELSK